jgi:hypothetical protein
MFTKTTTSSKAKTLKRKVSFNQIEIIELPYTIGDGPATGVPVTVGWKAQDRTAFGLDFFEQYRPKRRTKNALRLSPDFRTHL